MFGFVIPTIIIITSSIITLAKIAEVFHFIKSASSNFRVPWFYRLVIAGFLIIYKYALHFRYDNPLHQTKYGEHRLKETNELSSWSLVWACLILYAGVLLPLFRLSMASFQKGKSIYLNYFLNWIYYFETLLWSNR